jgi:hypothetical protein
MPKIYLNHFNRRKEKGSNISHFSSIRSQIRRKQTLVNALERIENGRWKGKVEVCEKATNLYGYHGDKRAQTAEIIIRRKNIGSASNDIGFKLQEDGTYSAVISDYDSSHHDKRWLDKLTQTYSTEVVREISEDNGFNFECREENGEIFINCERTY